MDRTRYVVDFDDLCDNTVDTLDLLEDLKHRNSNLKVTLFAIPARCSEKTIKKAKDLDDKFGRHWLQLAPHGWRHTRGECLAWTDEEAEDKIKRAAAMGIDAPVFRAPAWLLDGDVYMACNRLGYTLATHATFRVVGSGMPEYVYNEKGADFTAIHGHLTNTPYVNNYIGDMLKDGRLKFKPFSDFLFPQDVERRISGKVEACES